MKQFEVHSALETEEVGHKLGLLLRPNDVVLLEGDLSAGKTTFTKGIGKALGVKRVINSPTFTIVKTYNGNITLHHMDLYRLDGLGNDLDLYEYFDSNSICVVEWPHQVDDVIPNEYISVNIKRTGEEDRIITISAVGKKYDKLVGDI